MRIFHYFCSRKRERRSDLSRREARKGETERKSLAGSPKTSDGARDNLREARKRKTGRERLAGRPRERNSENDARGKPAERFLNV